MRSSHRLRVAALCAPFALFAPAAAMAQQPMRVVQGGTNPGPNDAAIGVGTPAATAVFPWANTGLAVRNARGELWFHEMPGEPTSPPRRLPGPPLGAPDAPPRAVFPWGASGVAVVTATGELLVHPVGEDVGPPRRIPGAPFAA